MIRPFSALRGSLGMSLGVSASWDIEFIDFVDNNYIFYPDYGTLVDGCWQKFKIHQKYRFLKNGFPCRNWPTQVEQSQQHLYNVWYKHILHIYNGYSYHVLTFIRIFVDKNTQISWIDLHLQPDRLKILSLHVSSIGPFCALTGPLGMSLGVSESWDIEFINIVDNKYNFFLDNTSMVDSCWQKSKFCKNTWYLIKHTSIQT